MSDDYEAGLTELAAKLRKGGVTQNAGCAAFLLRCRDEMIRLRTIVTMSPTGHGNISPPFTEPDRIQRSFPDGTILNVD